MDPTTNECSVCGQAAKVRILENYVAGKPVIRHFCFECADLYFGELSVDPASMPHRISAGSLLIAAGLVIGLLGILADHLGIHGNPGFGWYKQTVLLAGSLLICLGAFWRIDVMGVIGILMFLLAGSANLLGLAGSDGFGWKQQAAIGLGLLLVVSGVLLRRRTHRPAAATDSHVSGTA